MSNFAERIYIIVWLSCICKKTHFFVRFYMIAAYYICVIKIPKQKIMIKIYKLIAAAILFSFSIIKAQPVNGTTTFFTNTTTPLQANTACSVTKTTSVSGWLFSVQSTSNCGFNWTNSTGGDGRIQYLVGFGTLTQGTFGSDDGSNFAMQNMLIGVSTSSWVSKPMTYVGYSNGLPVPGATLYANTPAGTGILNTISITFTGNPAFNNVDEIRFAPNSTTCNSIYFIEEITIGAASCATNPTLTLSGSSNVSCNGGANGTATVSATGSGPFTYTWSPSGGNVATASGLTAGIYTCVVTNSCSLSASKTVTITQPSALGTSTAITNVACNGGSNGVAAISGFGGAGGYSYLWSNGGSTSVITGLMAGVYTATVTDANGCKATKNAVVTQPSALVTTTAVTTVACNGGSNGVASITASGGAGGYSYLWSNGASTSAITGLMAGIYTATVTDANSCTSIKSVIVTQPSALVTSTSVTNVSCNGGSNGVAAITASGGTGTKTYLWSNGATTSVITGLLPGIYTATVTDANGCTSIKSVNITQPSSIVTTTAVTNAACNGGTGSATLSVSGGAGGYSYLWSNGATTFNISSVIAGVYTATVTDANSCTSIKSVNITAPSAIIPVVNSSAILCNGDAATVTVSATGGVSPYIGIGTFTALAGTSNYTITDANGCPVTTSLNIIQPALLSPGVSASSILCNGDNATVTVTAIGGTPSYTGVGTFTAMAGVASYTITDANNCSATVSISVTQPPVLSANAFASAISCNGGVSTVTVSAVGGTPSYTGAGTYTMFAGTTSYTVTDSNGCLSTASATATQPAAIVSSQTASVCAGQSYTIGTNTYTSSGIYTDTFTAVNGCDSTVTTNLTVQNPIDVSTTLNNLVISANNTVAASYQWIDCNNSNQAIPGATVSAYTSTANGSFAVTIFENGCSATSSCVTVITTGIKTNNSNANVSVWPNPNNGNFMIDLPATANVEVIDALGRIVYAKQLNAGKQNIILNNEKTGVYFLKINIDGKQLIRKIVVDN